MSHAASSVEVVKILLAAGANINHRQKCNGQTPLTLAILHGNEKVVQALFDHGTLDLTNYNPEYLLSLAAHAEKEKMYNLLATCINKTKHKVA
jgi:ankyrin repeat protein